MKKQPTLSVDGIEIFTPANRTEWREWLQKNHVSSSSVWLRYFKKNANQPSIAYPDAVEEALCFGWIDSKLRPINEESYMQYFCKRKANSVWSKVNKEKVARLTQQGLMTKAGVDSIELAKANGAWFVLDEAEALIIPPDLQKAFTATKEGAAYFESLSRSDKRNILQWLVLAKQAATRQKRINEIVTLAAQKEKPKQFRTVKK